MTPPGEAVTMVTDYALALTAALAAAWLGRAACGRPGRWWAAGFLATAVAAVLGGTSHGYAPVLSAPAHAWIWRLTYVSVGVANLCVLWGAARAVLPRWWWRPVLVLLLARLAAVTAALVARGEFRYVLYDYAVTLAGLSALALALAASRRAGAAWVAAGVAASVAGALVQLRRLGLGPAFNHNDVFHVLQAAGLVLYARGGRDLGDAPPAVPSPGEGHAR